MSEEKTGGCNHDVVLKIDADAVRDILKKKPGVMFGVMVKYLEDEDNVELVLIDGDLPSCGDYKGAYLYMTGEQHKEIVEGNPNVGIPILYGEPGTNKLGMQYVTPEAFAKAFGFERRPEKRTRVDI